MQVNIRIPFDEDIGSRDATLNKDSIVSNGFFDIVPAGNALVKRPGLENKTSALGLGVEGGQLGYGQGIIYYEDIVYSWNAPTRSTRWSPWAVGDQRAVTAAYDNPGSSGTDLFGERILFLEGGGEFKVRELPAQTGPNFNKEWFASVWTEDKYFVGGVVNGTNDIIIAMSTDLDTFTTAVFTEVAGSVFTSAIFFLDTIFFYGTNGSGNDFVYTSVNNGTSWTRQVPDFIPVPTIQTGTSIGGGIKPYANNDTILVMNSRNSTSVDRYSLDGLTSTPIVGTSNNLGETIVWTGSQFVSSPKGQVSSGVFRVYTSPDGITWTPQVTSGEVYFGTTTLNPLAADLYVYGNGVFVASTYLHVGNTPYNTIARFAYSTDGLVWNYTDEISQFIVHQQATFVNGAFYCLTSNYASVGGSPVIDIMYLEKSLNGSNWMIRDIDDELLADAPTQIEGSLV